MRSYLRAIRDQAHARFRARFPDWRAQMIWFVFNTAWLFLFLYLAPWFGAIKEEARLAIAVASSIILSTAFLYIYDWLRAPSEMWHADQDRLRRLSARLSAKLVLSYTTSSIIVLPIGVSGFSMSGGRYTDIRGYQRMLRIECRSQSDNTVMAAQALLSRVVEYESGANALEHHTPLRLVWHWDMTKPMTQTNIHANTAYYIHVVGQISDRGSAEFMSPDLDAMQRHALDKNKKYIITVQVQAQDAIAQTFSVVIWWKNDESMFEAEDYREGIIIPPPAAPSGIP